MKKTILIIVFALASLAYCGDVKREKRDFTLIEKKKVGETQTTHDSAGNELPSKDLNYYGPEGTLFPMIEFPTEPKIEFSE